MVDARSHKARVKYPFIWRSVMLKTSGSVSDQVRFNSHSNNLSDFLINDFRDFDVMVFQGHGEFCFNDHFIAGHFQGAFYDPFLFDTVDIQDPLCPDHLFAIVFRIDIFNDFLTKEQT